jgi:hypothetical protein
MSLIISEVITYAICDRYELDILQLEPRRIMLGVSKYRDGSILKCRMSNK